MSAFDRLLQYGVTSPLATKAISADLSASKIRALAQADLIARFGLEQREAAELKKCVTRQPIDPDLVSTLLARSNHLCCVCKGQKGDGVVLHHIIEYERSQDNSYGNLAVLCPNDHDRAHHGGLTIGLTAQMIQKAREQWEHQVEVSNAQKAAQALQVRDEAVDYVNVSRIEEMCMQRFKQIPATGISPYLRRAGILGKGLHFDEKFVWSNLSNGSYLFDYARSRETEHYRQLLEKLSEQIEFEDLSEAARSGIRRLKAIEGKYSFFIGAVTSKRPAIPITKSEPFEWRFKTTKVEVVWHGDAKYLMSMSAISRQGAINRYILYGLVRTVLKPETGPILVTCSPLFVAQPAAYVNRTPAIAYQRRLNPSADDDLDDDDESTALATVD